MTYREPDRSVCDEEWVTFPLEGPPDPFELTVDWWQYRGRMVRWCVALWQADPKRQIVRIDTCEGEIHRHTLHPDGSEDRLFYETIPDRGWEFVDAAYSVYYERAMTEWAEWVRRWRGELD